MMIPNVQRIPYRKPLDRSSMVPNTDQQAAAAIDVVIRLAETEAITPDGIAYRNSVRRVLGNVRNVYDLMSAHLSRCESPIEKMLLIEMFPGVIGGGFELAVQAEHLGYRLDLAIIADGNIVLAIECDGHEYHERTKEQAARDRARDRALLAAGIRTARFTGSEIYRNPAKCAREVWDLVRDHEG